MSDKTKPKWKVVPTEPTDHMKQAARDLWAAWDKERYERGGSYGQMTRAGWETAYYQAMIAAAPGFCT